MNKKKALQTAKDWLFPALMYAIHDCCDSMHDSEKLENRFNAFVEDSIDIADFVKKNLYKEYLKQCIKVAQYEGAAREDVLQELESTPSSLPIKFEEIKKDLEELLNQPF